MKIFLEQGDPNVRVVGLSVTHEEGKEDGVGEDEEEDGDGEDEENEEERQEEALEEEKSGEKEKDPESDKNGSHPKMSPGRKMSSRRSTRFVL